jgi:hypothetical protein
MSGSKAVEKRCERRETKTPGDRPSKYASVPKNGWAPATPVLRRAVAYRRPVQPMQHPVVRCSHSFATPCRMSRRRSRNARPTERTGVANALVWCTDRGLRGEANHGGREGQRSGRVRGPREEVGPTEHAWCANIGGIGVDPESAVVPSRATSAVLEAASAATRGSGQQGDFVGPADGAPEGGRAQVHPVAASAPVQGSAARA